MNKMTIRYRIVYVTALILALLLPLQSAYSRHIDQLLNSVIKIESSLKSLIEKESSDKQQAIKHLDSVVENLKGQLDDSKINELSPTGKQLDSLFGEISQLRVTLEKLAANQSDNLSAQDLSEVITDIVFLESKFSALEESTNGSRAELVSLDPVMFPSSESQARPSNRSAQPLDREQASLVDGRTRLEEKGVSFGMVYNGELMSNVNGGVAQRSEYLENGDIVLSVDAEKLLEWQGASFNFYVLGNRGGSPTGNIGDIQGVSNIEANDTWKLYEAWYQQNFSDDRISLLFGLYDLNSEFDVIDAAGLFLNSSFGIGPDYSQSGKNGPSIFPATSLALRANFMLNSSVFVRTAVLDGVSGDPDNPKGTHIKFGDGDGVLVAFESGYVSEESDNPYTKLAIGGWLYSARFDDLSEVDLFGQPLRKSGNSGLYVLGERNVYREKDHSQGLSLFGRVGFANTHINQIGAYVGGGAVYRGLIPGRNEDQLGLAFATAINGNRFKDAMRLIGSPVESAELTIELSYNSQILPQLAIHPDIQYVINPGTDPNLSNALMFGTRVELAF